MEQYQNLDYQPLIAMYSVFVILLALVINRLYFELRKYKFVSAVKAKENLRYKMALQNQIKERIDLSRSKTIKAEDIVAKYIYKQDCIYRLGEDLRALFEQAFSKLSSEYPLLTDLDLLVLALLNLEMENSEICSLLRMEKRTLYRRRQLMAQRIGLSSTELEAFAKKAFAD